jgi:hypothetical protein
MRVDAGMRRRKMMLIERGAAITSSSDLELPAPRPRRARRARMSAPGEPRGRDCASAAPPTPPACASALVTRPRT